MCARFTHETLIEKRLQTNVDARRSIRVSGASGKGGTVENAAGNFLGQLLPVDIGLGVLRLGRVSEKPAFDQHGRNCCFPQNKVAATPDSAIFRGRAANYGGMNTGSERRTFGTVEVCLDPVSSAASGGVEMNTDKNRVWIRIGHGDARAEGNEYVSVSRQDYLVAGLFQKRFQS